MQISRVTRITITRSNFTENQGNCLQVSYSSIIINASKFYNNGRVGYYTGRAIYAFYSKVIIIQSHFDDNIAQYDSGGAIFMLIPISQLRAQSSSITLHFIVVEQCTYIIITIHFK